MHKFRLARTISFPELRGYRACSIALSSDGQLLAVGGGYGEVYLYAIDNLEHPIKLPYDAEEYGNVRSVAFSPNSSLLASITDEGSLNIWDIPQHRRYEPWQPLHQEYIGDGVAKAYQHVQSLVFHPSNAQLFGGETGVYCWDVNTGQEIAYLPGPAESILDLAVDRSGCWLAGAGHGNHVVLWNLVSGLTEQFFSPETNRVDAVSFSPTEDILISGGGGDAGGIEEDRASNNLHLWSTQTLKPVCSLQSPSRWIARIGWHSNQRIMATAASYGNVTLWDSTTWEIVHILKSRCHYMHWVCFHPLKAWLLCAGSTADYRHYHLEIWQYEA